MSEFNSKERLEILLGSIVGGTLFMIAVYLITEIASLL